MSARLPASILLLLAVASPAAVAAGPRPAGDTYLVTLDPAAADAPATGRVVLFFLTPADRAWRTRLPARGPFWDPPQPIASMAVKDFRPGETVRIDRSAVSFPPDLDRLSGPARVQAVLDADTTARDLLQGPGNVLSEVLTVELQPDAAERIELRLTRRIGPPPPLRDGPNLRWIERRSPVLSAACGREVFHRAGVALPEAYLAQERAGQTAARWPVVYVIPDYGRRHTLARDYSRMLMTPGIEEIAPMAVYVILDPEAPLGHHGFADSATEGPRGTALVTELIPALEQAFRLDPRPEARILTGISSGGWAALWLQLNWPEVFGGCWARAPDPVDFHAFQACNLYEDRSLYTDAAGRERPSYRRMAGVEGEMKVVLTVREDCRMEYAMDPAGASGQQWHGWEAMFSPRAAAPRGTPPRPMPRPMFDRLTGRIDRAVVAGWSAFDIGRRVESDWPRYGPIVMERVRVLCGELDSFYLDGAVRRFKKKVEALAAAGGGWRGPGYVELIPGLTHMNLDAHVFQRVNREMRRHLREHGLAGVDQGAGAAGSPGPVR